MFKNKRKKPLYFSKFGYKLEFDTYRGHEFEHGMDCVQVMKDMIGRDIPKDDVRYTQDGMVYLTKKSDFDEIISRLEDKLRDSFQPAKGFENMQLGDISQAKLWNKRFPYNIRFRMASYWNKGKKVNTALDNFDDVRDWCEDNVCGPCYISEPSVFLMGKLDATTIKLAYSDYIININAKYDDKLMEQLLIDRIDDAKKDLDTFKND